MSIRTFFEGDLGTPTGGLIGRKKQPKPEPEPEPKDSLPRVTWLSHLRVHRETEDPDRAPCPGRNRPCARAKPPCDYEPEHHGTLHEPDSLVLRAVAWARRRLAFHMEQAKAEAAEKAEAEAEAEPQAAAKAEAKPQDEAKAQAEADPQQLSVGRETLVCNGDLCVRKGKGDDEDPDGTSEADDKLQSSEEAMSPPSDYNRAVEEQKSAEKKALEEAMKKI